MKSKYLFHLLLICAAYLFSQTAPPHLKYFGYAMVDMGWDDPHDISTKTNYIEEVDSFSNVAQMGVFNYTDNVIARTHLMTSRCVKPILSIQSIFYHEVDSNAPSGHHFKLYPNFLERWQSFVKSNLPILQSSQIASFYVADEPLWNGIAYLELDTVCQLIKKDFPTIPIMFIEAYPVLSNLKIPTTVDWVGFDRYAIFDPSKSSLFLNDLKILKSKLSTTSQRIFLVMDDQWLPSYGQAGFAPDTVRFMIQNYYNLAASDTSIVGLIGYLWAGGLDSPDQLGVRNMPQSVIDKNVEIGSMIKANNPVCLATAVAETPITAEYLSLWPNPCTETLYISLGVKDPQQIEIINIFGQIVKDGLITHQQSINISDLPRGIYFIRSKDSPGTLLRFIKQNQ